MRSHKALLAAIILSVGVYSGPSLAQHQNHHPDQGSAATGSVGADSEDGTQGQKPGCPMMSKSDGEGGMMQGGMCPMMQGGMGPGMMQRGMGAMFGSRVTPMMNLSTEDVRGYLDAQLDRLNNKRLKIGDVKSDDGTITADIVTVDNSLVQRLKVNRHTGNIEYSDQAP